MKLFPSSDRSDPRVPRVSAARILMPVIGLVVLAMLTVGATVYLAAQRLDQSAKDSSYRLARTALSQIEKQIAVQTREYAYWDATRENVVDRLDMDWVEASLGLRFDRVRDHMGEDSGDAVVRAFIALARGRRRAAHHQRHAEQNEYRRDSHVHSQHRLALPRSGVIDFSRT